MQELPKELVEAIVKHLDCYIQTLGRRIEDLPDAPIKRNAMRDQRRPKAELKIWRDELVRVSSLKVKQ